jgi:hydroxypyruvate isomerase
MWLTAHATLCRLAELGERAGMTFCLENLNTAVDHPGAPFARARPTLALVEAVDRPGPVLLDLRCRRTDAATAVGPLRNATSAVPLLPGRNDRRRTPRSKFA